MPWRQPGFLAGSIPAAGPRDGEGDSLTEFRAQHAQALDRCARKGWQSARHHQHLPDRGPQREGNQIRLSVGGVVRHVSFRTVSLTAKQADHPGKAAGTITHADREHCTASNGLGTGSATVMVNANAERQSRGSVPNGNDSGFDPRLAAVTMTTPRRRSAPATIITQAAERSRAGRDETRHPAPTQEP